MMDMVYDSVADFDFGAFVFPEPDPDPGFPGPFDDMASEADAVGDVDEPSAEPVDTQEGITISFSYMYL